MQVSDFMHKPIAKVSPNDTVKTAMRLMLSLAVDGLPVCKNDTYVGSIAEEDILHNVYPSIQDFMSGSFAHNFEDMEQNMHDLLPKKIKTIMNTSYVKRAIRPDSSILHAQTLMMNNEISHLPVVDNNGKFVGIISQGDIFKRLLGIEIPHDDSAEFHNWAASHYDLVQTWDTRLKGEIPSLTSLFKKNGAKSIIDIGTGTGEHVIALARQGLYATGIERSEHILKKALKKRFRLPDTLQKRITFIHGDYLSELKKKKNSYDAVILMGNMLAHYPKDWKKILALLPHVLTKGGTLFLQMTNFESILTTRKKVVRLNITHSKITRRQKYAFLSFYDDPYGSAGDLLLSIAVMGHDGLRWSQKSINSLPIAYLDQNALQRELKKCGFKHIRFYGSNYGEKLFNIYKPEEHLWLNVEAHI